MNAVFPGMLMGLLFAVAVLFAPEFVVANSNIEMPPMHHVVNVKPSKDISVPKEFELNKKGEIDCQTCHGIEDIKDQSLNEIDKSVNNFYRAGPYPKLEQFCFRCHDDQNYQRQNIHLLIKKDGSLKEERCQYCHLEVLDTKANLEKAELKFRLPIDKICLGCHLKTPHLNSLSHQQKVDESMLKRIRKSEYELKAIFPLDSQGRVTCVTCHAPHQKGVIDSQKPAGRQVEDVSVEQGVIYEDHPWNLVYQKDKEARLKQLAAQETGLPVLSYQKIKSEVLLRLPAKEGALCLACHEFDH